MMENDRGYAVVIVLLFLAVISFLGVGLMQMSRLDLQFTGAVKNYNKLFNLADGACGIAFNDLKIADHEEQVYYTGPAPLGSGPAAVTVPPSNTTDADSASPVPNPNSYPFPGKQQNIGKYYVNEVIQGYNDSAKAQPGWEAGQGSGGSGYHMENWTGEGHASRNQGNLIVEAATLKRK
ncbi:MAG: PilX N-terminal domain-containing pilus assembly protein [Desulfomonilaceae bacterium]